MKSALTVFGLLILFTTCSFAKIIHVPSEQTTITAAIEAANECDTVLVAPGVYKESIIFDEKNLTLASHYLTTGDTSFISNTILDGNRQYGLIRMYYQDTSTVIAGFTLTQGRYDLLGSVFLLYYSSPRLFALKIINNSSWGNTDNYINGTICMFDSSPLLQNIIIKNNYVFGNGGAVYSRNGRPKLENVLIENNKAGCHGGGLYIDSDIILSGVTIKNNMALHNGGGIYINNYDTNHNIEFDQENRCNVFLNYAPAGSDFFSLNESNVTSVFLDTMTVINPVEKFVHDPDAFSFDIQNSVMQPVNQDLYVSPEGDNNNAGTSIDQPLKTIAYALLKIQSDSMNTRTVHLANGTYVPNTTQENLPLFPGNDIIISGESQQDVIINPENLTNAFRLYEHRNVTLNNLTITGGNSENGGGIECDSSELHLSAVTLRNNYAHNGGGIWLNMLSDVSFDEDNRCNIYNNYAQSGTEINVNGVLSEDFNLNVVVDTFTVLNPTTYHILSTADYSFEALHAIVQQVNQDVYVSPEGDNQNSGLSPDEPVKSIELAFSMIIADSLNPRTVYLADGTYSPSTTNTLFPINPSEYVSLSGSDKNLIILDAEQSGPVLLLAKEGNRLENITVTGGYSETDGGGINSSKPTIIKNVIISDNYSFKNGGGINCSASLELDNVSITGNEAFDNGGGIAYQNPFGSLTTSIKNSYIADNISYYNGGGIFTDYLTDVTFSIRNTIVEKNIVDRNGGGMYLDNISSAFIDSVVVQNNIAKGNGGGIDFYASYGENVELSATTIRYNKAGYQGGGVHMDDQPRFNEQSLCSIYLNEAAEGSDLCFRRNDPGFSLDTFTVAKPTSYHMTFQNFYRDNPIKINSAVLEQIENDIYVSPYGDNSNSGLSEDAPLASISNALLKIYADSSNPGTIHLADGTYKPSDIEYLPLNLPSFITLKGSSKENTILDGSDQYQMITAYPFWRTSIKISDLRIQNGRDNHLGLIDVRSGMGAVNCLILENVEISNCYTSKYILNSRDCFLYMDGVDFIDNNARAVLSSGNNLFMRNSRITGNISEYSWGIFELSGSDEIIIERSVIAGNSGNLNDIWLRNNENTPTYLKIINSTFGHNNFLETEDQGTEIYSLNRKLHLQIVNSIIWNKGDNETIYTSNSNDSLLFAYSNIKGGQGKINTMGEMIWNEGNISEDPLFADTSNADYSLSNNSPCLNAGTDFFVWGDDTLVNLSPSEYFGSAPDMGAIENTDPATDIDNIDNKPIIYKLYQNYPNPFNPSTKIKFSLPKSETVIIEVYNIIGQKIETILNKPMTAGYHEVGFNGQNLSSGVYLYRIQAGEWKDVKKMVLLQ